MEDSFWWQSNYLNLFKEWRIELLRSCLEMNLEILWDISFTQLMMMLSVIYCSSWIQLILSLNQFLIAALSTLSYTTMKTVWRLPRITHAFQCRCSTMAILSSLIPALMPTPREEASLHSANLMILLLIMTSSSIKVMSKLHAWSHTQVEINIQKYKFSENWK